MKYKIVTSTCTIDLQKIIEPELKKGWRLVGQLVVVNGMFVRELILEENEGPRTL